MNVNLSTPKKIILEKTPQNILPIPPILNTPYYNYVSKMVCTMELQYSMEIFWTTALHYALEILYFRAKFKHIKRVL